jgi:nucleoside-diphosphate-sugar epimerase
MATKGNCAITGASGFVGGYLAPELAARGWNVVPVARHAVDFDDVNALSGFLRQNNVTHIVHLAAESNPIANDVRCFYEVNAFLTERLLEAASLARLRGRFLYVSASSVYGNGGDATLNEEAVRRPQNHYGASKLLAEVFADWFRDRLDITIARPSNCIGRRQNSNYLVPKLVSAFARKEPEIVMGDVGIARDFVDVRDAVDILARALDATVGLASINVASGRPTQIQTILTELTRLTGHRPDIRIDDRFIRRNDIRFQACDIARALTIGHVQRHRLDDTLSWMLSEAADSE